MRRAQKVQTIDLQYKRVHYLTLFNMQCNASARANLTFQRSRSARVP